MQTITKDPVLAKTTDLLIDDASRLDLIVQELLKKKAIEYEINRVFFEFFTEWGEIHFSVKSDEKDANFEGNAIVGHNKKRKIESLKFYIANCEAIAALATDLEKDY